MKTKAIIEKFDSKLIRLGSSLLGVTTSDYDYAVSESVWYNLYPKLSSKLQFRTLGGGSGSAGGHPTNYCSTNGTYPMYNSDNVKMKSMDDSTVFDFIIYKDSDITKVRNAVKRYIAFIDGAPETAHSMKTNKIVRIEIFQYFLNDEFNVTPPASIDLDELFVDL